jgi:type VI protein secretion system component Hcp
MGEEEGSLKVKIGEVDSMEMEEDEDSTMVTTEARGELLEEEEVVMVRASKDQCQEDSIITTLTDLMVVMAEEEALTMILWLIRIELSTVRLKKATTLREDHKVEALNQET